MKIVATACWAICLLGISGCASTGPGPTSTPTVTPGLTMGQTWPASDVPMMGVDGTSVMLSEQLGAKGTMVVFLCNHCPWSRAWEGRITALGNEYLDQGVQSVAINSSNPAAYPEDAYPEMQDRAESVQMKFPYVVDEGAVVARAFGVQKTPEAFVFNGMGELVYHGAVDDNPNDPSAATKHYLRDALDAVVTGKNVPVAETGTLGCSLGLGS